MLIAYWYARLVPGANIQRLVHTVDSSNEDAAVAAYMALVRLAVVNSDRVVFAIERESVTKGLLQLLGDLGSSSAIPYLESIALSANAEFAEIAQESLQSIQEQQSHAS